MVSRYLRERRDRRHAAPSDRHFGRARLAALQAERTELTRKLGALDEQRQKTQAEIAALNTAFSGSQSPQELAARTEEFSRAERECKEACDAASRSLNAIAHD